jgi:ABC-type sugar transport system substrate-binding protein
MKTSKSLYTILALALVMVFILAACAPEATPAPAEEPAGEAPTAEGGWCSGTKIVFFPGGTPGGGFETVVYNGAVQAAADTGADVEYVWSDWSTDKMTSQFTEAVATKPDGIGIMGHPGDPAFDPLIDDAESQGIIVTSSNTQLPLAQAKYAANGFGYVGLSYDAGCPGQSHRQGAGGRQGLPGESWVQAGVSAQGVAMLGSGDGDLCRRRRNKAAPACRFRIMSAGY